MAKKRAGPGKCRCSRPRPGLAPVVIRNDGPDTSITITATGIPAEPEPSGGKGRAIRRSVFTLSGQEVALDSPAQGTRLVVVLEITPPTYAEGRLMVVDPLSAGFEIDNPHLTWSGSTAELDWLDVLQSTQHVQFRQDRFMAAVDWSSDQPFRLAFIVRAVSPGTFHHPAALFQDMYRPTYRARGEAGTLVITPSG